MKKKVVRAAPKPGGFEVLSTIDEEGNPTMEAAAGAGSAANDQKAAQAPAHNAGPSSAPADGMDTEAASNGTKSDEQAGSGSAATVAGQGAASGTEPAAPTGAHDNQAQGHGPQPPAATTAGKPPVAAPKPAPAPGKPKANTSTAQAVKPAAGSGHAAGSKQDQGQRAAGKGQAGRAPTRPSPVPVPLNPEEWKQVEDSTTPAVPLCFSTLEHVSSAGDALGQLPIATLCARVEAAMRTRVAQVTGQDSAGVKIRVTAQWHGSSSALGFYSVRAMLPPSVAERMRQALTEPGCTGTLDIDMPSGAKAVLQLWVGKRPTHVARLTTDDEVPLETVAMLMSAAVRAKRLGAVHWVGQVIDTGTMQVLPVAKPGQQVNLQAQPVLRAVPMQLAPAYPVGSFIALAEGGDAMYAAATLPFAPDAAAAATAGTGRGPLTFRCRRFQGSVQHPAGTASNTGRSKGRGWERPVEAAAPPAPPKPSNADTQQHMGKRDSSGHGSDLQHSAGAPPAHVTPTDPLKQGPVPGLAGSASVSTIMGAAAATAPASTIAAGPHAHEPTPATPVHGRKSGGDQHEALAEEIEGSGDVTPLNPAKRRTPGQAGGEDPIPLQNLSTSPIKAAIKADAAKSMVRANLVALAEQALQSQEIMGAPAPSGKETPQQAAQLETARRDLVSKMAKAVMDELTNHGSKWKQWLLAGSLDKVITRQAALSLMRAVVKDSTRAVPGLGDQPLQPVA